MPQSSRQAVHIAVVGSVNLDLIVRTQRLPCAGETVGDGEFEALPGGKGANVAVAARGLGAQVDLWACVGTDNNADAALAIARGIGVNLDHVRRIEESATGVALINVSADGENQIAVAPGANREFSSEYLDGLQAQAIIGQFEVPLAVLAHAWQTSGAYKCLNPSPVGHDLSPLLPSTDLVIVNEGEFTHYRHDLEHHHGLVAVTLGADGAALYRNGAKIAQAAAPAVEVIDTTGAGDTFTAALVVALTQGVAPADALQFACNIGAHATTRRGAQTALPIHS